MANRPKDARYLETHEWGRAEKDGTVIVGITDFAVEQLNDLTFVDLPEVGDEVKRGEAFGEIESVKAVSDLISPITGKVTAVNKGVDANDFEAMKKDAFGKGWLLKVKAKDVKELDKGKSLESYEQQLKSEGH
ncbi:MAG: glycine cleavage system protein GcvH [Planctomycetes bacterium]|nr:glycine cleavage system protein GcvH [Planctomycetota bacterium]